MIPKLYIICTIALIVHCPFTKSLAGVPEFMLQLYNSRANEDGTMKTKELEIPRTWRCYPPTGPISNGVMVFNVTNTPNNGGVWNATINLYQETAPKTATPPLSKRVTVATLDLATGKRVSSRTVSSEGEGWVTFDVTALVTRWLRQPRSNQGLRIQVEDKNWSEGVNFEYGWKSISRGPLLVLYAENVINSGPTRPNRPRFQRRSVPTKTCYRHDMIVKVSDIKSWKHIISPHYFNAGRCVGNCVFPLEASSNPTNHATIQSLVTLQNRSINNPCCVPTKLGALYIMYFDDKVVTIGTFTEMKVKECGCH